MKTANTAGTNRSSSYPLKALSPIPEPTHLRMEPTVPNALVHPGLVDVVRRVRGGPRVAPAVGGRRWLEGCIPVAIYTSRLPGRLTQAKSIFPGSPSIHTLHLIALRWSEQAGRALIQQKHNKTCWNQGLRHVFGIGGGGTVGAQPEARPKTNLPRNFVSPRISSTLFKKYWKKYQKLKDEET